jgi:hypothetical protein
MNERVAYRVHFERVGRDVKNHDEVFKAINADDLAAQIHDFAGKHLRSRDYEVLVDLESMDGTIGWGRMGVFTIEDYGVVA